jgi:hypothetical protein
MKRLGKQTAEIYSLRFNYRERGCSNGNEPIDELVESTKSYVYYDKIESITAEHHCFGQTTEPHSFFTIDQKDIRGYSDYNNDSNSAPDMILTARLTYSADISGSCFEPLIKILIDQGLRRDEELEWELGLSNIPVRKAI